MGNVGCLLDWPFQSSMFKVLSLIWPQKDLKLWFQKVAGCWHAPLQNVFASKRKSWTPTTQLQTNEIELAKFIWVLACVVGDLCCWGWCSGVHQWLQRRHLVNIVDGVIPGSVRGLEHGCIITRAGEIAPAIDVGHRNHGYNKIKPPPKKYGVDLVAS